MSIQLNENNQAFHNFNRFVFLITFDCYSFHVFDKLRKNKSITKSKKFKKLTRFCNVKWKRIFCDEFHTKKNVNFKISTIFRILNHEIFMWFIFETSFVISSRDMKSVIIVMKTLQWKSDSIFNIECVNFINDIVKTFDNIVRKKKRNSLEMRALIDKWSTFLIKLIIERMTKIKWFDVSLMSFFFHKHFDINIVFNEKYVIDNKEHLQFAKKAIHEEFFKRYNI